MTREQLINLGFQILGDDEHLYREFQTASGDRATYLYSLEGNRNPDYRGFFRLVKRRLYFESNKKSETF